MAHVVKLDESPNFTLNAYQDCYNHYREQWDWMAFIDMTDWIVVKGNRSLKEILSDRRYNKFEAIRLNQVMFSDQQSAIQDLNIVDMMEDGAEYNKTLGMAKSIVNCVTNGLKMGIYAPTRCSAAIRSTVPQSVLLKVCRRFRNAPRRR